LITCTIMKYFLRSSVNKKEPAVIETTKPRVLRRSKCEICLEFNLKLIQCSKCSVKTCTDCLAAYLNGKIKDRQFPLECPKNTCKHELSEEIMQLVLSTSEMEGYHQVSFAHFIDTHPKEYHRCPTRTCDYVYYSKEQPPKGCTVNCPKCKNLMCLYCNSAPHVSRKCDAYQRWKQIHGDFALYVNTSTGKQCPKCGHFVERTSGCDYMQCMCKQEICYACGKEYHPIYNCDGTLRRYA
jgi:hypothetical protein